MSSLTETQIATLKQRLWPCLAMSLLALIIVITCTNMIGLSVKNEDFLDRGQVWLIIPLAALWMWIAIRQIRQAIWLITDLRTGHLETIEGHAERSWSRGFGLFAPMRCHLLIDGKRLYFTYDNAPPFGQSVQLHYAPQSRTLLSWDALKPGRDESDLTDMEMSILAHLACGESDKIIARAIGLSPATIRTYNSRLFQKLGVTTRRDAVRIAKERGLIHVD